MLRSTLHRSTRIITNVSPKAIKPRITRRYASGGSGDHARSSDLPWAIPSLAITVPVVFLPDLLFNAYVSASGYGLPRPRWRRIIGLNVVLDERQNDVRPRRLRRRVRKRRKTRVMRRLKKRNLRGKNKLLGKITSTLLKISPKLKEPKMK